MPFKYGVQPMKLNLLAKILTLQKKAVRMIMHKDQYPPMSGPLNPSEPLFLALEILKIHDVFKLQLTKFVFDCLGIGSSLITQYIITIQLQIVLLI